MTLISETAVSIKYSFITFCTYTSNRHVYISFILGCPTAIDWRSHHLLHPHPHRVRCVRCRLLGRGAGNGSSSKPCFFPSQFILCSVSILHCMSESILLLGSGGQRDTNKVVLMVAWFIQDIAWHLWIDMFEITALNWIITICNVSTNLQYLLLSCKFVIILSKWNHFWPMNS